MKMRALLDYLSAPSHTAFEPATVRPAVRPARLKPFWQEAQRVAEAWLEENGYPAPGDGGQAKLEKHVADWLDQRGHVAAESTIRGYVGRWIREFRDHLGR
jgi:hypothetical protein